MKKILEMFGEPILRGGQESFVMSAIQHMDLYDMQIDLLTPYYCKNDHYEKIVRELGGHVYALNLDFNPGGSRRNIVSKLAQFFLEHHYDIVHIHSGSISVLAYGAKIARKSGVEKVIVHSHSSGDKGSLKHSIIKAIAAPIFKKYATDFCACSQQAAEWKFSSKICRNKVRIIKNGVDTAKFQYNSIVRDRIRKSLGLSDNYVIGHVGRFTDEKNQQFLIDVLKNALEIDTSCKLVLVGDGENISEVEEKTKRYGIEDKVVFVGSVDNVEDYLQAFDVFVLPSLYEGFGLVAVEAEAASLPVVSSDRVPHDINLTGEVEYIPLENCNLWVQEILKYKCFQRLDKSDLIRTSGYDIKDTALDVEKLYL